MFNRSRKKIILSIMGSLILLFSVTLSVIAARDERFGAADRDERSGTADRDERFGAAD